MSKLPPRRPCYALFHGLRQSRPGYVEMLNEPVRVVEVQNGAAKELAVTICGRSTRWPIANFSGTWELLELGEDDDFAELESFWPSLEQEPPGRDIFEGVFPVSGESEHGANAARQDSGVAVDGTLALV